MELNLVRLQLTLELYPHVSDPCWLFGLRASLLAACRQIACARPGMECHGCPVAVCAWRQLFAQELAADPELVRRHQKPPLPFVLQPQRLPRQLPAAVELGITLFGPGIQQAPLLLAGLAALLASGTGGAPQGRIIQVDCLDYQGLAQPCDPENATGLVVLSAAELAGEEEVVGEAVGIEICTPLQLMADGRLLRRFVAGQFLRMLLRRISAVSAYYGAGSPSWDFPALARASRGVVLERGEFRWQEWQGPRLAGVLGAGVLAGQELGVFLPLLRLGSLLQVGKGCSFGLGRYRLLSR